MSLPRKRATSLAVELIETKMECLHQFTGQQQVTLLTGWQFMSGTTNNEAKNTSAVINSSARRSRNDIASAYVPTRYMHL